jgi:uncharacterized SAM-binding protein YcdF (DUF218 family)
LSSTSHRLRRRLIGGLAGIVALGLLIIVSLYVYIAVYGYRSSVQHADAIVVLGAAVRPANTPTPALAARALLGVALWKEGQAPLVILTGGVGAFPPAEAEVMHRIARTEGVPEESIIVEDQSHSTIESSKRVGAICRGRGIRSVIVVTDPFHTIRAGWMFRDQGLIVYTAPTDDTYYSAPVRAQYTLREVLGVMAYAVQRVFRF